MARNFSLAHFGEHVRILQTLVYVNEERRVSLTESMAKIWELLESGHSIDLLDYFVKFPKLSQQVQRLSGFVKSKDLERYTLPWLVDEASRLQKRLSILTEEKD